MLSGIEQGTSELLFLWQKGQEEGRGEGLQLGTRTGFPTSRLSTSEAGEFFVVGGLAASETHKMSTCTLPVMTTKNISRHCQMFPGGQNHPELRTTGLEE